MFGPYLKDGNALLCCRLPGPSVPAVNVLKQIVQKASHHLCEKKNKKQTFSVMGKNYHKMRL